MTTYKNIKGIEIKYLSADPPAPNAGQVWYNSTSKVVKGAINGLGAWASGGNVNTARAYISTSNQGTQTATLAFAGAEPARSTKTEKYNGTAWTEVNDLSVARFLTAGAGTMDSALCISGESSTGIVAICEAFDGTNWTETGDLNSVSGRQGIGAAGASSSAVVAYGGSNTIALTEVFDGSSWTEVNNMNTARASMGNAGTSTAALTFGGATTAGVALAESWNGTSWTEVADLNTARTTLAGAGSQTSALAFGGGAATGTVAITESWNGSSWTEVADMATARVNLGGAGTTGGAALGISGTPSIASTEEFTVSTFTTKTFDTD
mgnify:CR=1 FL=1